MSTTASPSASSFSYNLASSSDAHSQHQRVPTAAVTAACTVTPPNSPLVPMMSNRQPSLRARMNAFGAADRPFLGLNERSVDQA
ncbi:hypothetical protein HDU83_003993 [Entophlyctis luteolus]|nr:hypothetical protein HDU83_003993 [Entophlyctis luteolus]